MPLRTPQDYGQALALRLSDYRTPRPLVLGLQAGGLPIAEEIARCLAGDLQLMQAEGISAPGYSGAVAETGEVELDRAASGASEERLARGIVDGLSRMLRKRDRWLPESPVPDVKGRSVVLVADGLASGARMRAALRSLRARNARRVAAVCVAATEHSLERLRRLSDDVVCLLTHPRFGGVGRFLRGWKRVPDETACRLLRRRVAARL